MPNIGKYEIESRIGHGGMGDVYRAFDPTLRRRVAVKVLKVEGDAENLNRFRLEATSAGNLNHANIVTIYDYDVFEGEPYIVMEYLEGEDLQRTIDSGKKFDLVEITDIMSQVSDALECAHQAGVIHRDVKPANIMLLTRGGVKLMDFGIARLSGANTQQTKVGHLIGTVLYMSPEQFHNLELDGRVDIWAFGVIYYQLLAGKHPFAVPDQMVTMYNITNKPAPPICSVNHEVPEALGQIVDRCLSKDRDQRYASMEDLRYDVMPVLQDLSRQQAARMIGEARKLMDLADWDAAQALIRRVLELDPADRTAIALRRTIADALRKRESAPRIATLASAADRLIEAKDYTKAAEAIESALKIDPAAEELRQRATEIRELMEREKRAQELLRAARQDLATEHFTGAYQNATEVLRFDPGRAEAIQLLAMVQAELDRRERGKHLREGLEKARNLLRIASFDEAIAALQQLIASHPGTLEASQLLREAELARENHLRTRKLQDALSSVKELLRLQRFPEAVHRLEALTSDFPGENEVIQILHYAREEWKVRQRIEALDRIKANAAQLQAEGRFDEALHLIERSHAEFPDEPDLLRLSQALTAAKAEAERRAALERVIQEAHGRHQSGEITAALKAVDLGIQQHGPDERLLGVRDQLERDWQIAQRTQSYQKAVQEGHQLTAKKDWEKAIAHYQQMVRQFPEDAEARKLLAEAEACLAQERRARVERDTLAKVTALENQNQRDAALAEVELALRAHADSRPLLDCRDRLKREIADARQTHERELKLFEARRKAEEEQRRRNQDLEEKAREQRRQLAARVEDCLAKAYLAIGQGELTKAGKMIAEARKTDSTHPGLPRAESDLQSAQQLATRQATAQPAEPKKPLPIKAIGIGAAAALVVAFGAFAVLHKASEPARLSVSPISLELPVSDQIVLTGSGAFTAKTGDSWLAIAPSSGNLPATVTVTGNISGLAPGPHSGAIDIAAGDATRHVAVTLTVEAAKPPPEINKQPEKPATAQPDLSLSPESLSFEFQAGSTTQPTPRVIYVSGTGHFQAAVGNGQLVSISPSSGKAPGQITIVINPTQLPPGTYSTQLTVASQESPALKKFARIRITVTAAKPADEIKPPVAVVPPPPPPLAVEPAKCSSEGYLGRRIGDIVWNGTLPPNGKVVLQPGGGSYVGPSIPRLACFDVSNLPPGIRATTAASTLTLTNTTSATITTIPIHWAVR